MRSLPAVSCLLPLLLWLAAACSSASSESPGEVCARAAGIYTGLVEPVSVDSEETLAPDGVTVHYRGFDGLNVPAEGEATCVFADPADPGQGVTSASIDGTDLGPAEIAALNEKLGGH
jgi:hypothetical protein